MKYKSKYRKVKGLGGSGTGLRQRPGRSGSPPQPLPEGEEAQRRELFRGRTELTQQALAPVQDEAIREELRQVRVDAQQNFKLINELLRVNVQQSHALSGLQDGQDRLQDTTQNTYNLSDQIREVAKTNAKRLTDLVNNARQRVSSNNCKELIQWRPSGYQPGQDGEGWAEWMARRGYNAVNRTAYLVKCVTDIIKILLGFVRSGWNIYRTMWSTLRSLTDVNVWGILRPFLFVIWAGLVVLDIFITYLLIKGAAGFVGCDRLFSWIVDNLSQWTEQLFRLVLVWGKSLGLWVANKLEAEFDQLFTSMTESFGRLYDILDEVILQDQQVGPRITDMISMFKTMLGRGISIMWNARCMVPPFSENSTHTLAICGRARTFRGRVFGCPPYPCWTSEGGGSGCQIVTYHDNLSRLSKRILP